MNQTSRHYFLRCLTEAPVLTAVVGVGLFLTSCAQNQEPLVAQEEAVVLATSSFYQGESAPGVTAPLFSRGETGTIAGPGGTGGTDQGTISSPVPASGSNSGGSSASGTPSTGDSTAPQPTIPPASGSVAGATAGGTTPTDPAVTPAGSTGSGSSPASPTSPSGGDGGSIAGPSAGGNDGGQVGTTPGAGTVAGGSSGTGATGSAGSVPPANASGSSTPTPGSNDPGGTIANNGGTSSGGGTPSTGTTPAGGNDGGSIGSNPPVGANDGGATGGANQGGTASNPPGGTTGSTDPNQGGSGNPNSSSGGIASNGTSPSNQAGPGNQPGTQNPGAIAGGNPLPGGHDGGTLPGGSSGGHDGGNTSPNSPSKPPSVADLLKDLVDKIKDFINGGNSPGNKPNPGGIANNGNPNGGNSNGGQSPGNGHDGGTLPGTKPGSSGHDQGSHAGCTHENPMKIQLGRVCSVRRSQIPYPGFVFFEEAATPIISIEGTVAAPKRDVCETRKAKLLPKPQYAAVGFTPVPQDYQVHQTASGLLNFVVESVSLSGVNLFDGKFQTEVSLRIGQLKKALGSSWSEALLHVRVCDDTNHDGRCSDEKSTNILSVASTYFPISRVPKTVTVDVWNGRFMTAKDDPEICEKQYSPLLLDLTGQGFNLVGPDQGVYFDLNATGESIATGWTSTNNVAFLVRDIDGNGRIDNGAELFGSATTLKNGQKALNGFEALKDLDSNGDGHFTPEDRAWREVKLWVDRNHNGYSERDEIAALQRGNIESVNLNYIDVMEIDPHGNQTRQRSTFRRTVNRRSMPLMVIDIWFNTLARQ